MRGMASDSPLRWLRKTIFRATQDEIAAIGGVSRPRVSRYETGESALPFDFMARVRAEGLKRDPSFTADWFFEVPASAPDTTPTPRQEAAR